MKLPASYKSTHLTVHSNGHMAKAIPHIGFILDASGSMEYRKEEAIYSFNLLLRHQVLHRRKATFNLTTFSKYVNVGSVVDIKQCSGLSSRDYQPSGQTPLYDAIGETVEKIDEALKNPTNVVVVILTDGHENASKDWKLIDVHALIQDKRALGWTFIYCSCAANPILDALKIGIPRECATDFTNLPDVFTKVSKLLSDYRDGTIKQITFERRD
jgi:Mg-chelatase subunit ChlD